MILYNGNEIDVSQIVSYIDASKFTLKEKLPFNVEIKFESITNGILKYVLKAKAAHESKFKNHPGGSELF